MFVGFWVVFVVWVCVWVGFGVSLLFAAAQLVNMFGCLFGCLCGGGLRTQECVCTTFLCMPVGTAG